MAKGRNQVVMLGVELQDVSSAPCVEVCYFDGISRVPSIVSGSSWKLL